MIRPTLILITLLAALAQSTDPIITMPIIVERTYTQKTLGCSKGYEMYDVILHPEYPGDFGINFGDDIVRSQMYPICLSSDFVSKLKKARKEKK